MFEINRFNIYLNFPGGPAPTTPHPEIKPPTEQPPPITPPPTVTEVPPPPPPVQPKVVATNSVKTPTPYPNKGIILQSLNYIQMDVFSSMFANNKIKTAPEEGKPVASYKRETALLSEALSHLENNFRSLF